MQRYRFFFFLITLGVLSLQGITEACGMQFRERIPAEQALISFANGREEVITSVHLQSNEPGAAVLFPVPGVPEVSALPNNDLFNYLAEVTKPEIRIEEQLVWMDNDRMP